MSTGVWAGLIGQDDVVQTLRTAAAAAVRVVAGKDVPAGAMTHSWLFSGPPGSGRSVAARAFAAALQCEHPEDPGCGSCAGCHLVQAGTHPDVHLIVPEGLSIGVDLMRSVVATAARRPMLGKWQVVLIEDADRLTEGAANALLKAVEEPPARTVFMLCTPSTHPEDLSLTIRSRCRLVTLRTPSAAAIAGVLADGGIDVAAARWAAAAGQGHVGRARRLAGDEAAREHRRSVLSIPASLTSLRACLQASEQLLAAARDETDALTTERDATERAVLQVALGGGGTGKGTATVGRGATGQLRELEKRQQTRAKRTTLDTLDRALVDLAGFYRDVLLAQAGSSAPRAHPDFEREERTVAERLPSHGVLRRLDAVLACRLALEQNVKPQIAVEALTAALRLPAAATGDHG